MMNPLKRAIPRATLTLLACGILTLSAGVATAQPAPQPVGQAAADAGAADDDETLYSLLMKGGWLMVPILLASLVALTVTIERSISLRRRRTVPPRLLERVFHSLPRHDPSIDDREEAAAFLASTNSILGNVLRAGVLRLHRGEKVTEKHLEEALAKEIHLLKRRLRPLSVVASVAPLLGLLGTIYGMIQCFSDAGAADSSARTETLANGIYAALVTTASGLTVAIPAMLLYHWFLGRVERVADLVEDAAMELLEHFHGDDNGMIEPATKNAEAIRAGEPARPAKKKKKRKNGRKGRDAAKKTPVAPAGVDDPVADEPVKPEEVSSAPSPAAEG